MREPLSLRGLAVVISTGAVVVVLDQLTKWWAVTTLPAVGRRPLLGQLITLQLSYNTGGAFSSGENLTWMFGVFSLLAAIAVLWFARRVTSLGWAVALGALFGGAVSHFGDRMLRGSTFGHGYVIDFIDYLGWFIGNVADIAIVVSVCALAAFALLGVRPRRPDTAAPSNAGA